MLTLVIGFVAVVLLGLNTVVGVLGAASRGDWAAIRAFITGYTIGPAIAVVAVIVILIRECLQWRKWRRKNEALGKHKGDPT